LGDGSTNDPGTLLGIAALLLVGISWAWYARAIVAVRVPANRRVYIAVMGLGTLLGALSFAVGNGGPGAVSAGAAVIGGLVFIGLRAISGQDKPKPAVSVGEPILDFDAPDEDGHSFSLASLHGRPFLLKFFRGHW